MKVREQLGPGGALLLYPMNALANDQLARLRKLLVNYPKITFGRYTGETEEPHFAALEKYRELYGTDPLDNELISREAMWASPPHILLTNYAMLEYLLLRPRDSVFFEGVSSESWRFIVIDEAHTYAGARGIEIAMLLRRLKDRVVQGETGKIQCIATSATLGRVKDDYPAVAKFARDLFGEEFSWDEGDPDKQDVVEGQGCLLRRQDLAGGHLTLEFTWSSKTQSRTYLNPSYQVNWLVSQVQTECLVLY